MFCVLHRTLLCTRFLINCSSSVQRAKKKQKQTLRLWVFSSLMEGFYKIKTSPVALSPRPRDCLHWLFLCQIISKCPFLLFVWDTATSTCLQMSLYICFYLHCISSHRGKRLVAAFQHSSYSQAAVFIRAGRPEKYLKIDIFFFMFRSVNDYIGMK